MTGLVIADDVVVELECLRIRSPNACPACPAPIIAAVIAGRRIRSSPRDTCQRYLELQLR